MFVFFLDIMPLWRGRDRPRIIPVNKEAISTPHAYFLHGDPLVSLEFLIPPVPQVELFSPMILEVF